MHRRFALIRDAQCTKLSPNDGETVGEMLNKAADLRRKELESHNGGEVPAHCKPALYDLYHLAADAYIAAAQVSIGHSRAERYEQQAQALRDKAAQV